MDNLPRISRGETAAHEQRARLLRPALAGAGGLSVTLLIVALMVGGGGPMASGAGWLLAAVSWTLLGLLALFGLLNVALDAKLLQPYPDLGRREQAWVRAGASRSQLRILNEAHRLDRLSPPVGYGDRRTLINPLADAYAIFTSPAWRDSWLADRKLLIDPLAEAAEIITYVHHVTSTLADVRSRIQRAPVGSAAQRTYQGYERALLTSLDDGLKRARALTAYRHQVSRLALLLRDQEILPEAEAFADRVLDVLSESARQEMATRHLEDSREQLRMLEAGLREITKLLASAHHPELTD